MSGATHYLYKEEEILAHFRKRGMLRYKDTGAFFCVACEATINVKCPSCKFDSETHHGTPTFRRITETYERHDGYRWVQIECRKCDYTFKVIAQ